jgi:hypothetical protein
MITALLAINDWLQRMASRKKLLLIRIIDYFIIIIAFIINMDGRKIQSSLVFFRDDQRIGERHG